LHSKGPIETPLLNCFAGGMVYLEPHQLGWRPLTLSWLARFPADTLTETHRTELLALFDWLVPAALRFVRVTVKEATPTQVKP
jgi:dynein heavy chain